MKYLFPIVSALLLMGCSSIHNRKFFDVAGSASPSMLTNGYYYADSDHPTYPQGLNVRMLLDRGYVYARGGSYGDRCADHEGLDGKKQAFEAWLGERQRDSTDLGSLTRNWLIWSWGKYEISGEAIRIQYFYNHHGDYYLLEERGHRIDSASFQVTTKKDYRTGEEKPVQVTYRFQPCDVTVFSKRIPVRLLEK